MKIRLSHYLFGGALLLVIVLSGCYTQMGTVRNDRGENDENYSSPQQSDNDSSYAEDDQNYYDNGYYNDWDHPRVGFSYYYPNHYGWPSYEFSAAYGNPWYYDAFWWGSDPWMYGNPYYYGSPFLYGGYYPPYYYSPYYSYGYGNGYGRSFRNTHRAFGSTRGSANRGINNPNGGQGGYAPGINNTGVSGGGGYNGTLPTAGKFDRSGNRSAQPSGTVNSPTRQQGNDRSSSPRVNGSDSRGTGTRGRDSRDARPQFHAPGANGSHPVAPKYRAPRTITGNHGDTGAARGGNAPSYRAPARSAPAPSHNAPAPSRGNSGSGGRGGNSRSGGGGRR